MKKCKHDYCKRKAEYNGYCDECIQLNTERCNYCSEVVVLNEKETKPKNRIDKAWIMGGLIFLFLGILIGISGTCIFQMAHTAHTIDNGNYQYAFVNSTNKGFCIYALPTRTLIQYAPLVCQTDINLNGGERHSSQA